MAGQCFMFSQQSIATHSQCSANLPGGFYGTCPMLLHKLMHTCFAIDQSGKQGHVHALWNNSVKSGLFIEGLRLLGRAEARGELH